MIDWRDWLRKDEPQQLAQIDADKAEGQRVKKLIRDRCYRRAAYIPVVKEKGQ